jgi:hypothetical protein
MPYSSRTLVAALLLLGTAQAGFKALFLPLPTLAVPAALPSTTFPVPDPEPATIAAQRPGDLLLAQSSSPSSAPTAQPSGLSAWWWLLPAAGGAGVLGWAASRRKSPASEATEAVADEGDALQEVAINEGSVEEVAPEEIATSDATGLPLSLDLQEQDLQELELAFPDAPPAPHAPVADPWLEPTPVAEASLAASAAAVVASTADQTDIEASKFNVVGQPTDGDIDLSTIDDGLPPLPDGYGESRIVLMPRDPQWAYVYWDTPHTHKEDLRRQGGERLALRLYDITDIDPNYQAPHGMQQCDCDELAQDWYLQVPVSDRDYQAEIGYLAHDGRWLLLARSNTIHIPPIYPSDWSEDHFKTVTWEEDLRGKTLMALVDPTQKARSLHEQMYALSQAGEGERVDGSVYGSMPHVPGSAQQVAGSIQHVAGSMAPYASAESSYAWGASGAGILQGIPGPGGAVPTLSGIGMMSGVGMGVGMSGVGMSGMNVSGLTMSGISGLTMSGVGFSASMPPARPRKFWLVADAELIVHGATEPDATVTIAGQPIPLTEEGTFRVHTSFPDGNIDYPIMAVAADGEQSRSIHMTFDRQTPDRQTNTQEEAQDEWFPS